LRCKIRPVDAPEKNINWTYGLGGVQTRWSARVYMTALTAGFIVLVFVPTDLLLRHIY
jgi:hypothetical protein